MTNYEKIKNMSVEEMARIVMCPYEKDENYIRHCNEEDVKENCNKCVEKWLNKEVSE